MLLHDEAVDVRGVEVRLASGLIKAAASSIRTGLDIVHAAMMSLPTEDQADVMELLRELITTDDEEARGAAMVAIEEILNPPQIAVKRLKPRAHRPTKWTAFISAKVRQLRAEAGLTQEQLAERSGMRQSHICRIERGEHSPNGLTLEKLAKGLGAPISKLDPSGAD